MIIEEGLLFNYFRRYYGGISEHAVQTYRAKLTLCKSHIYQQVLYQTLKISFSFQVQCHYMSDLSGCSLAHLIPSQGLIRSGKEARCDFLPPRSASL